MPGSSSGLTKLSENDSEIHISLICILFILGETYQMLQYISVNIYSINIKKRISLSHFKLITMKIMNFFPVITKALNVQN